MLEHDPAAREPLHPLVEVVALEIDGGGCRDRLLRVDLDRQGRAARALEAGIAVVGAVDDLAKADAEDAAGSQGVIDVPRAPGRRPRLI